MKSQEDADEVFLRLFAARRLCVIVFEAVDDTGDSLFDQREMEVGEQVKTLVGTPAAKSATTASGQSRFWPPRDVLRDEFSE